jgi:hypothetical protein
LEGVLGPSFFHKGKRDTRNEAAKKPFRGRYSSLVGSGVPLFLERKGGDEGEERASPVLHPPFDNPTRLLSKKTARMGDKAKPLVSWAGGFAV